MNSVDAANALVSALDSEERIRFHQDAAFKEDLKLVGGISTVLIAAVQTKGPQRRLLLAAAISQVFDLAAHPGLTEPVDPQVAQMLDREINDMGGKGS